MRKWLRDLRQSNNRTQWDIAKHLGISQSSYCKIETGERQADLNLSIAVRLASFFDITVDEVVYYETKITKRRGENI